MAYFIKTENTLDDAKRTVEREAPRFYPNAREHLWKPFTNECVSNIARPGRKRRNATTGYIVTKAGVFECYSN